MDRVLLQENSVRSGFSAVWTIGLSFVLGISCVVDETPTSSSAAADLSPQTQVLCACAVRGQMDNNKSPSANGQRWWGWDVIEAEVSAVASDRTSRDLYELCHFAVAPAAAGPAAGAGKPSVAIQTNVGPLWATARGLRDNACQSAQAKAIGVARAQVLTKIRAYLAALGIPDRTLLDAGSAAYLNALPSETIAKLTRLQEWSGIETLADLVEWSCRYTTGDVDASYSMKGDLVSPVTMTALDDHCLAFPGAYEKSDARIIPVEPQRHSEKTQTDYESPVTVTAPRDTDEGNCICRGKRGLESQNGVAAPWRSSSDFTQARGLIASRLAAESRACETGPLDSTHIEELTQQELKKLFLLATGPDEPNGEDGSKPPNGKKRVVELLARLRRGVPRAACEAAHLEVTTRMQIAPRTRLTAYLRQRFAFAPLSPADTASLVDRVLASASTQVFRVVGITSRATETGNIQVDWTRVDDECVFISESPAVGDSTVAVGR